jgi:GNAT superfamily N-acetyltransferase
VEACVSTATPPDLTIRRASTEDAAAVRELTRLAYAKWIPLIGREPTPMTADYDRIVREDLVDLLLLDGELVAIVWMVTHPDHLLVENLAVAPAHQGLGLGRHLLAHAEGLAVRQGLPLVRLYTNQRFVSNIAFYTRSGYRIDREEPFWGGVKVHMSKRVDDPDVGDVATARPAPA